MPAVVTTTLLDAVWSLIENGAATPPLVLAGNRIKRSDPNWRTRDRSRLAPNDFPKLEIEVGVTGTHSGFNLDPTFAVQNPDGVIASGEEFDVERVEEIYIRITERKPTDEASSELREAVVDDIMRGDTRMGVPSLVVQVGRRGETETFRHRRRDTRQGETDVRGNPVPFPGTVTEIRFFVTCLESGQATLVP